MVLLMITSQQMVVGFLIMKYRPFTYTVVDVSDKMIDLLVIGGGGVGGLGVTGSMVGSGGGGGGWWFSLY